jgi:hypothetical protein
VVSDPQRLLQPLEALGQRRERDAQPAALLLVPGGADAEPGATARQHVQGGHALDQHARVPRRHPGDHGAKLDALRLAGREGQRGVGLEHLVLRRPEDGDLEEMVHNPQARQAGLLGVPGDPPEDPADARRPLGPGKVGDCQSDSQDRSSRSST